MTVLILFDVDGTLTVSGQKICCDMILKLEELSKLKNIHIGIVGGSDFKKQEEQLGKDILLLFKWIFSENGLVSMYEGREINKESIVNKLGNNHFTELINICLLELSKTKNPIKRGNFIQHRNGIVNVSPIGRSCTLSERKDFYDKDNTHKWREDLITRIKNKWVKYKWFNNYENLTDLDFSIGGQISIDIFPVGWDKTFCLSFVKNKYDLIYFFGDKTFEGGNDYKICNHPIVKGYTVKSPNDTIKYINQLFIKHDNI
tara:strand:- start:4801 stop:5577 length:777 start_codon:yes stop_codon:yes gene_type:complete